MLHLSPILAAGSSTANDAVGFVLFCAFIVVAVGVNYGVYRARKQHYDRLMEAMAADPGHWASALTGQVLAPGSVAPVVYHCGSPMSRNQEHLLAFDDQTIVAVSIRMFGSTGVVRQPRRPSYRTGVFRSVLEVGPASVSSAELPSICTELAQLGWQIIGGPVAGYRPPPPSRVPPPTARPPANTPVPPTRSAHSPTGKEIECGGEALGPAIDEWLDAEDLEDIE